MHEVFVTPLETRFRDLDALGHVNNAVYVTYLEIARVAFARDVLGNAGLDDIDFLVARIEIDYRRPVHLNEPLRCALWIEALGRTSFTLRYELLRGDEAVAAARSVQVFVDRATGRPKPVPGSFAERVRPYAVPSGGPA